MYIPDPTLIDLRQEVSVLLTACVVLLCLVYLIVRHMNTLEVPPVTREEFAEFRAALQRSPQEPMSAT